jgi:hypothetical protein
MGKWIPCGEKFIVGDVIRWTEPIWHEPRKKTKGKKAVQKIGERRVTAEVLAIDARDYVSLSICACEIVSQKDGLPVELFKKKQLIRKKRSTIGKGSGERLNWSEEDVRLRAVSKFLR